MTTTTEFILKKIALEEFERCFTIGAVSANLSIPDGASQEDIDALKDSTLIKACIFIKNNTESKCATFVLGNDEMSDEDKVRGAICKIFDKILEWKKANA